MPADALTRLSRWYEAHYDGEREHHHPITLTSCDNPGWWMKVDLTGTELAARHFLLVSEGVDPHGHPAADRWLHCRIEDNVWHGAGDETRLKQIVELFVDWAEATGA